jgi:uncharacterized protein (DUF736 family)
MIIGKFKQHDDTYAGSIYGLGWRVPFVTFTPAPAKQGNGPDFVVHGAPSEAESIEATELSAAWKRTSKKGRAYLG